MYADNSFKGYRWASAIEPGTAQFLPVRPDLLKLVSLPDRGQQDVVPICDPSLHQDDLKLNRADQIVKSK